MMWVPQHAMMSDNTAGTVADYHDAWANWGGNEFVPGDFTGYGGGRAAYENAAYHGMPMDARWHMAGVADGNGGMGPDAIWGHQGLGGPPGVHLRNMKTKRLVNAASKRPQRPQHAVVIWNLGPSYNLEDLQHDLDDIDFSPDEAMQCSEAEGAFVVMYFERTMATALIVCLHGTNDLLGLGKGGPVKVSRWSDSDATSNGTSPQTFHCQMDDLPHILHEKIHVTLA
eukprot:gnl/TRDRNA2_/TRDRNA2_151849_c0_seq1.p1 gnl/TRDRNA2_/TRDRNA2_151849_c0~~gnl/TRDRNA2_/TRDRNA2_151849_c0_seq1.p1  ORF type:complete len:227 (-),score=38.78 gnl/TRDRNA2_/TRDRNA2_151849_c0_seq1:76-756(-)